jgi:signal transduction histidine kinase
MALSADDRVRILLLRLGTATIASFQLLFWVARAAAHPEGVAHQGIRASILAVCAVVAALTCTPLGARRVRTLGAVGSASLIVLQGWLAAANGLTLEYALPAIILFFAVCAIASSSREMTLFTGSAVVAPLIFAFVYRDPRLPLPLVSLLLLWSASAGGAMVSWFRLRSQAVLRHEIARREEVEAQLRGTRAHLESILHATSDGLLGVRYAPAGPSITFANRRFGDIFALDPEAVVGRADDDVRAQAAPCFREPEAFDEAVRRLYAHPEESAVHELELVQPSECMLERWTGPIRDQRGAVVGRIWAFRDVTSQRRLTRELKEYAARLEATNAELARASQAKDAFLANLSHELRTPLSVIIGYQNLVLEGGLSPEESAEFIQRSTASATHLLRLISDMLDLTRLEAGTAELTIEPLAVGPVIGEIRDLTQVLASNKGLELRVASEGETRVLADRQRLNQVLLNLVGNALKFTDAGMVTVSARTENGHVSLAVHDTGRGIPLEQQGLLFRKFMRLDTRTTAPEEGVGLGLSICRELVTLLGGSIELASAGAGAGTEVRFTLPRG